MPSAKHKLSWPLLLIVMVFGLLVATCDLFDQRPFLRGGDPARKVPLTSPFHFAVLQVSCRCLLAQSYDHPLADVSEVVGHSVGLRPASCVSAYLWLAGYNSAISKYGYGCKQIWSLTRVCWLTGLGFWLPRLILQHRLLCWGKQICCRFQRMKKMSILSKPILRSLSLLLKTNIRRLIQIILAI